MVCSKTMRYDYRIEIQKQTNQDNVYYTIFWSGLKKADKYEIIKSVPSVSGLFELYYMDHKKKLNLFFMAKAWYGGLRNSIRKMTDAELERNPARRQVLQVYDCYYRYTMTNSYQDMSDILYFFSATYFPGKGKTAPSGRYTQIFVQEESPDKIVTI